MDILKSLVYSILQLWLVKYKLLKSFWNRGIWNRSGNGATSEPTEVLPCLNNLHRVHKLRKKGQFRIVCKGCCTSLWCGHRPHQSYMTPSQWVVLGNHHTHKRRLRKGSHQNWTARSCWDQNRLDLSTMTVAGER